MISCWVKLFSNIAQIISSINYFKESSLDSSTICNADFHSEGYYLSLVVNFLILSSFEFNPFGKGSLSSSPFIKALLNSIHCNN